MIKVGQKVKFRPFEGLHISGCADINDTVRGVVVFVHPTHRYFTCEYDGGAGLQKISFKFDDIGKACKLVNH